MEKPNFKELADHWPSAWVARDVINHFSGGILTPKYCGNLDSRGLGIEGRFRVGRKIVYPVSNVIAFIESRTDSPENFNGLKAGPGRRRLKSKAEKRAQSVN